MREYEVTPGGLRPRARAARRGRGGDVADNAAIVAAAVRRREGPARDVVLLNAAAAIIAAGLAPSCTTALPLATQRSTAARRGEKWTRSSRAHQEVAA